MYINSQIMASIVESSRELSQQKPYDKGTIVKLEEYAKSVIGTSNNYDFDHNHYIIYHIIIFVFQSQCSGAGDHPIKNL